MQGFVQVQNSNVECTPDNKGISPKRTDVPLSLAIISRRSVERPGLRYQRRGVNASGGVANFVETEFLLSCEVSCPVHKAAPLKNHTQAWRQASDFELRADSRQHPAVLEPVTLVLEASTHSGKDY